MRRQKRFKIQRRLGVDLPGFGDKKAKSAMSKRPYNPGLHGQRRGRALSDFALRLKEKQKIKYHYLLREKQLVNLIKKAKRKEANWLVAFVDMAERRLDNLVFRLGFFPTIPSSRQMVIHGHIKVDGKKCTYPGAIIPVGAKISLADKSYKNPLHLKTRKEPTLECPAFLRVEKEGNQEVGAVLDHPKVTDIPFEVETQYFIEYYGRI